MDAGLYLIQYLGNMGLKANHVSGGYLGSWNDDKAFWAERVVPLQQEYINGTPDENGIIWIN
ncbi:MAG: hypothetical protein IKL07_09640, partial [Clostridium sp.]|nr:hypothetical protein [Clostridium sp.]